MANLTSKSKKGKYYIDMYNKAVATSLKEFYTRYSTEKGRAEKAIKEEMARYNNNVFAKGSKCRAVGYKVICGNCMTYTAGYRIEQDDITIALIIHTAYNKYVIMKN